MKFEIHGEIVGEIRGIETIASAEGIHILPRLIRLYGQGNWRKLKGFATVQFEDGTIAEAEIHWFEAHGIGKRRMKSNASFPDHARQPDPIRSVHPQ